MENNQSPLYKNFLFDLNCQYETEEDGNNPEVNFVDDFNDNDNYFSQSYVEFNSQKQSLDNSSFSSSKPYISNGFDSRYDNGDSFLSTTINYIDYDDEDDAYQVDSSEISYLDLIRKSEIAVSQQNASITYDYSDNDSGKENIETYKIVCIDDSRAVVNAIKMYLDDNLFSVIGINDPLKALMQIVRIKPDLILLDISMPTLDGYELCSLLRKHSSLKETPVIMVTGKKGILNRVKAKMVKASDYLTKPFQKKDLLKVIFKYIV